MKAWVSALLLVAVILSSTFLESTEAVVEDISGFCDPKCAVRCSKSGRPKLCLKYCGICCRECYCVPPGTYGNKDMCPCYRDKMSSKGKPKCP